MTKTAVKERGDDLLAHAGVAPDVAKGVPSKKKTATEVRTNLPAKAEPQQPMSMLAIIARAASDPACIPEKMRALLDMQKEIHAEEARIAFTQSYIAMAAELPMINATGRIVIEGKAGKKGQKTPYATHNEITRVTKPILQKHGFILWFEPDVGEDSKLIVRGHLDHRGGHGKTCAMLLPLETSGSKNNVQGVGSSMSYGKRYCEIALLNLVSEAPEDNDDDAHAAGGGEEVKPLTKKQIDDLVKAIADCGIGPERFLEKYKIEKVVDLPVEMLDEPLAPCARFKRERESRQGQEANRG